MFYQRYAVLALTLSWRSYRDPPPKGATGMLNSGNINFRYKSLLSVQNETCIYCRYIHILYTYRIAFSKRVLNRHYTCTFIGAPTSRNLRECWWDGLCETDIQQWNTRRISCRRNGGGRFAKTELNVTAFCVGLKNVCWWDKYAT